MKHRLKKLAARQSEITVSFTLISEKGSLCVKILPISLQRIQQQNFIWFQCLLCLEKVCSDKRECSDEISGDPDGSGGGPAAHLVPPGDGGEGCRLCLGWTDGEKLCSDPGNRAGLGQTFFSFGALWHRTWFYGKKNNNKHSWELKCKEQKPTADIDFPLFLSRSFYMLNWTTQRQQIGMDNYNFYFVILHKVFFFREL